MTDPGEMQVAPTRRSPLRNLSMIWLVPLLALALVGYIAWKSWSERGTLIQISFRNAAGITAGETTVRLRDVAVGTVEKLSFTRDLSSVIVGVRMDSGVARTLPPDAIFWVVRPEVSARGISGLDTVLSGAYIAAAWEPGDEGGATDFTGLEQPPAVEPGRRGSRITIRARDGNLLSAGAPVIFHGIEVGRLEQPQLNPDGSVSVAAFIDAPNDARLTTATRFWDLSGFSVSFGASGLTLNVASLASLVSGGVSFDNVFSGGQPLPGDYVFDLFPDEAAARDSVFSLIGANAVSFRIEFEGTVNGLAAGAPVMYRGLRVGKVESIGAYVTTERGRQVVRLQTIVTIDPQAMGLPLDAGRAELMALLSQQVEQEGLRARLATQNLFTSALMVQLVEQPEAPPARLVSPPDSLPLIPSTASDITDVTATAEGVLRRINQLPIEELLNQAIVTLDSISAFTGNADTQAVPGNLNSLLSDARAVIGSDDAKALPADVRAALEDLRAAAGEIRTLVAGLNRNGAADRFMAAVDQVGGAAERIGTAAEGLPPLVEEIRAVAAKLNALEIEAAVASVTKLSDDIDAYISGEAAQAIPERLTGALREVQDAVAEFRATGAPQRLSDALTAAGIAAGSVTDAVRDVPLLVEDLRAVARKAEGLQLDQLVASATGALDSVEAVLGSQGARDLPPAMTAALRELAAVVAELRETNTVDKLVAALDAAYDAALTVDAAGSDVPLLVEDLRQVAQKAERLDLETLVANVSKVLDSADAFIGSEGMRDVPPALSAALEELRATLSEVREGGLIENASGAMESARQAAESVAQAADSLPALADRLQGIADQAEAMIAAYGARSDANRELLSALREIRDAGRAISSLARSIERNPNSLLLGR